MEDEEEGNNGSNQQTIQSNNPTHASGMRIDNGLMKNDDQYIWMLIQVVLYFEIIDYENQTFCIMY